MKSRVVRILGTLCAVVVVTTLSGCAGMQTAGFKENMVTEKAVTPDQLPPCPRSLGSIHLERVEEQSVDENGYPKPRMQIPAPVAIPEKILTPTGCFSVVSVKDPIPGQPSAPYPKTDYTLKYTFAGESNMNSGATMTAGAFIPGMALLTQQSSAGQVTLAFHRGTEPSPLFTTSAAISESKIGYYGSVGNDMVNSYPGGKQYAAAFTTALSKMIPRFSELPPPVPVAVHPRQEPNRKKKR